MPYVVRRLVRMCGGGGGGGGGGGKLGGRGGREEEEGVVEVVVTLRNKFWKVSALVLNPKP